MTVLTRGDGSVLPLWVLNHSAELGMDLTEGSTTQTRQFLEAAYEAIKAG